MGEGGERGGARRAGGARAGGARAGGARAGGARAGGARSPRECNRSGPAARGRAHRGAQAHSRAEVFSSACACTPTCGCARRACARACVHLEGVDDARVLLADLEGEEEEEEVE